ncbi:MAG: flippase-like domain-containing protein [Chloroflexi bacterium]|nr:flippase-like domain-containing protein [Chloroflexota bacterium]
MRDGGREGSRRALFLRAAGTLLTLGLLFYLLGRQGWQEILGALRLIPAWRFALALALTLLSRLAVTARWLVLLVGADTGVTPGQSARITFAGLFASNFLPTTIGGDVVRLAGAIQLKFDPAVSTASLVVDRLVGMAGMASATPFALPALGAIKALLLPAAGMTAGPLAQRAAERLKSLWAGLLAALRLWLRRPRWLLAAFALTWVHQISLFASIWLLLDGMGEPMPFLLIAGLWSLVYFITLAPVSINGYGVQELSMALLYTGAGGVSDHAGLTVALLVRTLAMLASLPGALYVPGIMAGERGKASPVDGVNDGT